ncbi:exonuclease domain-containing protein [Janibacter alittae]|uniref:Exonuclease domain-containing protein n=1 Tax=Janibacter alittae TaxID=3115209 RepID=A0ABZ2MMA8_9MICO
MPGLRRSSRRRRQSAAAAAPPGPLRDYLSTPFPDPRTPLDEVPLLAIDVETTGLDVERDRVIAAGWVPVDGATIDLAGARRHIVGMRMDVGDSATVHGITDDAVAAGSVPKEVLVEMLEALTGRVLLAHHASIEVGFLSAACQRVYGAPLVVSCVDTLALQHRVLTEGVGAPAEPLPGQVRLWASRERYGLPRYHAHEPLTDALACAELYLAQVAELSLRSTKPLSLKAVQRA